MEEIRICFALRSHKHAIAGSRFDSGVTVANLILQASRNELEHTTIVIETHIF